MHRRLFKQSLVIAGVALLVFSALTRGWFISVSWDGLESRIGLVTVERCSSAKSCSSKSIRNAFGAYREGAGRFESLGILTLTAALATVVVAVVMLLLGFRKRAYVRRLVGVLPTVCLSAGTMALGVGFVALVPHDLTGRTVATGYGYPLFLVSLVMVGMGAGLLWPESTSDGDEAENEPPDRTDDKD